MATISARTKRRLSRAGKLVTTNGKAGGPIDPVAFYALKPLILMVISQDRRYS